MAVNVSVVMVLMAALVWAIPAAAGEATSQLWGREGELWEEGGRLPDFSFAGYRRGEAAIPDVPVVANVRDFGAVGDGEHDDTDAFKRAIAQTDRGAILIPAGKYVITDVLELRKPNIVLRGAGTDQTTLFFPKPLNDIRPNVGATTGGRPTSNYSWSGGLIAIRGDGRGKELAEVAPARRGERTITLSTTRGLEVGQEIELRQQDLEDNSLAIHLYANQPGGTEQLRGRINVSLVARIESIDGDRVTLDRALRWDIDPKWKPRVLRFDPTVREVGVESLRFEFPVIPYEGHFTELGNNAIAIQQAADCWVRDIVIDHCDSGIFLASRFCTLQDIVFNTQRSPDKLGNHGHHGISSSGEDNLITRFRFNFKFIHDITFTNAAAGNVAADGGGVDLCFDHHKRAPHANLFTNLDAGEGSRLYRSGGGEALGKHTAAHLTLWNIRTKQPQSWPPPNYAPDLINLVGLYSTDDPIRTPDGKWFEPVSADESLTPQNLHQAQLEKRLGAR